MGNPVVTPPPPPLPAPPPLPPRQRSFAGPVVLIILGLLFLMGTMGVLNWRMLVDLFGRFWPILLIIWGVIKLLEYKQAQREGVRSGGIGVGGAFLVVFLVVTGLIATQARQVNWGAIGDEIDIGGEAGDWFGNSYSYNDDLEQPFPAGGNLHVNDERGAVTVSVSSDDKIRVSIRKRIRADKQEEADKYNTQTKPEITVSDKAVTINANTQGAGEHGVITDLDISIPRKADVFISSRRGDVQISDREGNLQISAQRGAVTLDDIVGNVSLSIERSSVRADKIAGDFSIEGRADEVAISDVKGAVRLNGEFMESVRLSKVAKTVTFKSSRTDMEFSKLDGDLDLDSDDLRASAVVGPVRLITRSKDIRLEDVSGDVRLQDSNGGIDVSFRTLGSVQIENRKGDIEISVPPKASFHVEARNRGGEIDTDFEGLNVETVRDDSTLNGSVGTNGPRMVINNEHGSISLRQASLATPAPPATPALPALPAPSSSGVRGKAPKAPPAPPAPKGVPVPDETEN